MGSKPMLDQFVAALRFNSACLAIFSTRFACSHAAYAIATQNAGRRPSGLGLTIVSASNRAAFELRDFGGRNRLPELLSDTCNAKPSRAIAANRKSLN